MLSKQFNTFRKNAPFKIYVIKSDKYTHIVLVGGNQFEVIINFERCTKFLRYGYRQTYCSTYTILSEIQFSSSRRYFICKLFEEDCLS